MTVLVQRGQGPNVQTVTFHDVALEAGNIAVDQNDYTAGLDRIFATKGLSNMHIETVNTGLDNGLTYRIESARKEFLDIGTLTDADFNNEVQADTNVASGNLAFGTVTIASPVANTFAFGTVTCVTAIVGDTVTANGLLYTAVSGAPAEDEFNIDTGDTETATSLAAQITADTRSGTSGDLTATSNLGVVTMTTDVLGTGGNAITLISSDGTTLAVTGSGFLTGGVTADTVIVNLLTYTAVVGARSNDTEFSIDGNDTATATDLAAAITADVRVGTLDDVTAVGAVAVVTITQTVRGTAGNATTLTSSDAGRLLTSGTTFSGGAANGLSTKDIINVSPTGTAIRIRVKRETSDLDTTYTGIVSAN